MAQTKKCKQMHEEQVAAAQEIFKSYKKFIIEEFVNKFGGSYETASNLPTDWRTYYAYKPECEEFLIDKSKTFIHVAPSIDRKHQSPTFLRNLTSLISEYLSSYIAKKGWKRNDCTKYLQEILFDKNQHVQKETQRYIAKNNREWGLQQKAKREQAEQRKTKRREASLKDEATLVHLTPEQEAKIRHKYLKEQIEKKQHLLRVKPKEKTPEEEAKFQTQIEAYKAACRMEMQKRTLQVNISIKGIIK